jgi:hypothetical protein
MHASAETQDFCGLHRIDRHDVHGQRAMGGGRCAVMVQGAN